MLPDRPEGGPTDRAVDLCFHRFVRARRRMAGGEIALVAVNSIAWRNRHSRPLRPRAAVRQHLGGQGAGDDVVTVLSPAPDHAQFFSSARTIALKLVAERCTGSWRRIVLAEASHRFAHCVSNASGRQGDNRGARPPDPLEVRGPLLEGVEPLLQT